MFLTFYQFIFNSADYDWWRVLRFSLYGGLFVAPTLYSWIKVSTAMWPETSLRIAVMKAAVETISYTPAAMTCFYFIMSLLEMKTIREAAAEVSHKFLPTYKVNSKNRLPMQVITFKSSLFPNIFILGCCKRLAHCCYH